MTISSALPRGPSFLRRLLTTASTTLLPPKLWSQTFCRLVPRHDTAGVGVEVLHHTEFQLREGTVPVAVRSARASTSKGRTASANCASTRPASHPRTPPGPKSSTIGVEVRLFDVLEGPSVITRGLPPSGQTPEDARAPRAAV